MALSVGPITINSGERLCAPLSDILILTSALAYSTLALKFGSIPTHNPNLGFSLPCAQFPFSIKMPIHGPLEGMMNGETVANMTLQAEVTPTKKDGNAPSYQIGNVLLHIVGPVFSHYYERQAEWLIDNLSTDPNQWPMLFRFARVVRNAVVHLGTITIRNPKSQPVVWQALSYSSADNGREIYVSDMNTGDFIALMIDIDHEMTRLGAPAL